MPNLPKFVTRFILPVAFVTTVFQLPVQANTVRIIGPSDDDQPFTVSDRYRDTGVANSYSSLANNQANSLYGPTTANETLWGIASRYRPNNSVSIYQVIGAIHRANPQSFENNNIHGLEPGSQLRMPTMAQIQREDIANVKRRLEVDQRRQTRSASATSRTTKAVKSPTQSTAQVVATPIAKPEKAKVESVTPPKARSTSQISTSKTSTSKTSTSARASIPPKPEPTELQEQLDASDEQMTKLLESNHLLRVRLSEMQYEVSALKDQITDDEALRGEIISFLEQQKEQPQVQTTDTGPSWFDQFISNPWMLAAAGLIPGGLIAGAIAFFMLRRRKDDEDSDIKALENQDGNESPIAPVPLMADATDSESDLMLSEDQDIDDLFASDDSLFGNPEESLFDNDTNPASSKMLDDTTSLDLSSDLDDEFGLDLDSNSGLSSRSISVKGDDRAIGLEDMERALDQIEPSSELSSDEALAAMWEKSLQEQADDEQDFDLSDDADNEFDSDLMSSNSIEDGLLDQSILDDLLAEVEAENKNADTKNNTTAFSETLEANIEESAASNAEEVVDQSELDALFDSFDSSDTDLSSTYGSNDDAEQAAVDQALADAEAMFNPAVVTESDELIFEEGSTALLDDIVEDDEFSSDIEIEENSTALLDELLSDGSTDDAELTSTIEIAENSTALLDELIGDADDTDIDQLIIDENSTDLLDEILEQKNHVVDADDNIQDEFSDPEFESALSAPLQEQQSLEEDVSNKPDADFPESEAAAFDAILNEALQADEVATNPSEKAVLESATDEVSTDKPADDVDALITDIDHVINEIDADESEDNDVETIERSVTDLLEELDAAEALVAENENENESKSEEHPIVDLDDFPIFDEEAALSELDERSPARDSNPIGSQIGESLSVEELPEFDEDTAFNDPEADALEDDLSLLSEDDERIALDNVVKNLQQAVEASESYGNNVAQPQPPRTEVSFEHEHEHEHEHESASAFEAIDPTTLPEFSEDDALQASHEEQNELEQYELEQGLKVKPVADMFDEDFVDSAGLDMDALLTEPVAMFTEAMSTEAMFTETMGEQAIDTQAVGEQVIAEQHELDDPIVPEHTKQDVKVSVNQEIEAAERDGLLFDEPLSSTEQDLDFNSLDFMNSDMIEDDADDLSVPEEDAAVWAGSTPEPELESEDWSIQPEMKVEDVTSFDPESLIEENEEPALTFAEPASVLLEEEEPLTSPYISIDELMKEQELTNPVDLDAEPLNLDVGLDEFPDVLAGIESYDVDSHGEYSSKLDLAKAYLEMNDAEGAIGLLEEVAQKGDSVSQREATNLLTQYKR